MVSQVRNIGMDIHSRTIMVTGVNSQQEVVLSAREIPAARFWSWARANLLPTDRVVLESTGNAWSYYDGLQELVAEVVVANTHKIKLISASQVKTDKRDALVLAKLLAAHLVPAVWVPPMQVRELRSLTAHRRGLVRERRRAKNRLQSILYRHNLERSEWQTDHGGKSWICRQSRSCGSGTSSRGLTT